MPNECNPWRARLILLLLFTAVVVFLLALPSLLGVLVRRTLVNGARERFGVRLEIGRMEINPFTASLRVRDVALHNPPGFESPVMLAAPELMADFNVVGWLLHRDVHFEDMTVNVSDIVYETRADGQSNVDVLMRMLTGSPLSLAPPVPKPAPPPRPARPASTTPSSAPPQPAPETVQKSPAIPPGPAPKPAPKPAPRPEPVPASPEEPQGEFRIDRLRLTLRRVKISLGGQLGALVSPQQMDLNLVNREYRNIQGVDTLTWALLKDIGKAQAAAAAAAAAPPAGTAPKPNSSRK